MQHAAALQMLGFTYLQFTFFDVKTSLYDPYICILQLRVVLGVPDNTTLLQPSDHIIVLMQWDTTEADKVKAE